MGSSRCAFGIWCLIVFPTIHGIVNQAAAQPAPIDSITAFQADMAAQNPITVVTYGDSWTYGLSTADFPWAVRLGAHIQADNPNAAFANEGVAGWDSDQGLTGLSAVTAHAPDYCILNFGINDWGHTRGSNTRTVPQFTTAMSAMIDALESAGCRVVLWVSGPVRSTSGSDYGCGSAVNDSSYAYKFIDYADALKGLALDKNVPILDVRQAFIDHHDNVESICPWFWNDIHFNQLGHDFMYAAFRDELLPAIKTRIVGRDTFTDTNGTLLTDHTPDLDMVAGGWSSAWSSVAGSIQSNRFEAVEEIAVYVVDAGASGMVARASVEDTDGQGNPTIVVRHNGAGNANDCWTFTYRAADGTYLLNERNGGVVTQRDSAPGGPPTVLEARAYDDRVEGWADGSKVVEYFSTDLNQNTHGGFGNFTSMGSSAFDEFSLFTLEGETAPIVTLVRDTFTDTNGKRLNAHTPNFDNLGGGWVEHAGTWEIQSNAAHKTATAATHQIASIDTGASDCVVTLRYQRTQTGTASRGGLAFRVVDADNFWGLWANGQNLQLYEVTAGAFTKRGEVKPPNGPDAWDFAVTLDGNDITVDAVRDGSTIYHLAYSSAAHAAATRHGLWALDTTGVFEEFEVAEL